MISYELAKQLKDAGFPQKNSNEYTLWIIDEGKEACQLPTLSELIEACGENFRTIILHTQYRKKLLKPWEAVPNKKLIQAKSASGVTPEEAVAKLWLSLNSVLNNKNEEK